MIDSIADLKRFFQILDRVIDFQGFCTVFFKKANVFIAFWEKGSNLHGKCGKSPKRVPKSQKKGCELHGRGEQNQRKVLKTDGCLRVVFKTHVFYNEFVPLFSRRILKC